MPFPKGKLLALVAVFAAIGIAAGTGAFTTVTAERTAEVGVAGDSSALVAIDSTGSSNSNSYFQQNSGTAEINLQTDTNGDGTPDGQGVNLRAHTTAKNVFTITNQGSQAVAVTLTTSDNNNQGEADSSGNTEASAVRFAVPAKYGSDPGTSINTETAGSIPDDIGFRSNKQVQISNAGGSADFAEHGILLQPGESIQVGIYIDTAGTDFDNQIEDSTPGNLASNSNSDDLIDTVTIHAEAESTDTVAYDREDQSTS